MNPLHFSKTILPLTVLAFSSSLMLGQQTAPSTPASPDAAPATAPAPVYRQPPSGPHVPLTTRSMGMQVHGPMGLEHGIRTGPMGFGMERKWWHDTALAQQLNLTPDQIKRMDTVFDQSRLQLIDLRANVEKQEILLEPLLSANPVDMSKARAQIEKVARARADLEVASAGMLLGIRALLTPDQWTSLNQRHDNREFHRQEGSYGRMRPNGGSGRHEVQPAAPAPPPPGF